jgi:ketosteroid isomerase-like protein
MDREQVAAWVGEYERLWRTPGTEGLAKIFTPEASYLQAPFRDPVVGLPAIQRMWEDERDSPEEGFEMRAAVLAVEADTAVVRVHVSYSPPLDGSGVEGIDPLNGQEWLDLWVIQYAEDGRCQAFEEWPFAGRDPDPA